MSISVLSSGLSTLLFWRHMMLAEPMSPLVPNLTASLVTLISTAGQEQARGEEEEGRR